MRTSWGQRRAHRDRARDIERWGQKGTRGQSEKSTRGQSKGDGDKMKQLVRCGQSNGNGNRAGEMEGWRQAEQGGRGS